MSTNRFAGVSLLRKEEKKQQGPTEAQLKMQEYLKRYAEGGDAEQTKKKKKKVKKDAVAAKVQVIDEDLTGFKVSAKAVVQEEIAGGEEEDPYEPVVVNAEEAKLLQRQLEKAKNFFATDEEGAGWVAAEEEKRAAARSFRHDSPDASPPRRARHDSPDASPPRRARHDSPDASPPRRARHDSPDASPPRRARHDSPDASPPRRSGHDRSDHHADLEPDRKRARIQPASRSGRGRPDDSAVERSGTSHQQGQGGRGGGVDLSPPRRGEGAQKEGGERTRAMADGSTAGLVSREVAQRETQKLRQELEARRLRAQGRGEQTVVRDKETGRIMTAEELAEREREKKAKQEEDQHLEWRGGLAQKRAVEERLRQMEEEAAKPFARHEIDDEADRELQERDRWGDPMAGLVKKKKRDTGEPTTLDKVYNQAALKKSGFIVPQEIPPHSWIRRKLQAPPNRYNIKPGRHWDGVDRSNGREKQLFTIRNEIRAREQEAHEWAVADM